MADWKKLLKAVLLADGSVDASETALLRDEIMADAIVDDEEVEFLVTLRNAAKSTSDEFNAFFFEALKRNILADGVVDAGEVARLRKIIFADGIIDANEKAFMKDLKASAKSVAPEFEALLAECLK